MNKQKPLFEDQGSIKMEINLKMMAFSLYVLIVQFHNKRGNIMNETDFNINSHVIPSGLYWSLFH